MEESMEYEASPLCITHDKSISTALQGHPTMVSGKDSSFQKHGWRPTHITGDLFSCPRDESLAHCISEDCRMGAGIAVMFRKKFGEVARLKGQKKQPGQCAVLKRDQRFIYYLVTKKKASQRPTYMNLRNSLEDMKSHCLKNGVKRISMPRIGCGLDLLQLLNVSKILEEVFKDTEISITVYSLPRTTPVPNDIVDHPRAEELTPVDDETENLTEKTKARHIDHAIDNIIQENTKVMGITEELLKMKMLHKEAFSKIIANDTNEEKMRELYRTSLRSGGEKVKAAFYDALKKLEPEMLKISGDS